MNLTEWILASAVVLLWLYALAVAHRVQVWSDQYARWRVECDKELRALHKRMDLPSPWATQCGLDHVWSLTRDAIDVMNERLNKLDPPRRRATDKKGEPCHCGPTADGYVRISPECPHWNARAEYGAIPKKKAAKR